MRVGLHGRNAAVFTSKDFEVFNLAKIEMAVMMSFTENAAFDGLLGLNPNMKFIVRLYDDRIGKGGVPAQELFVKKMIPEIRRLSRYTNKFQIHNEPNHVAGIEGWGSTDGDAYDFAHWYKFALRMLRIEFPDLKFGFPGLALNWPHRDLAWLQICQDVIDQSDWLGCHCYWQYGNMLNHEWGMRHALYHDRFPDKPIHITEFGDSTPGLRDESMANQYRSYYDALKSYKYVKSASAFIATSPDPTWAPFCWAWENGTIRQVVRKVGDR